MDGESRLLVGAQAAEISAESETSAKSLERRGCVIANLKCTDAQVGVSVLYFVAACAGWCHWLLRLRANLLMGFDLLMLVGT